MFSKHRQQAWIHGLPGYEKPGGVSVEVADLKTPKSDIRMLNAIIITTSDLISNIQKHSISRSTLPEFALVIRTDPKKGLDDRYNLTNAIITSAQRVKKVPRAVEVKITYDSILISRMAWNNPGPPVDAPVVQRTSTNIGWIYCSNDNLENGGIAIDVIDMIPPQFDGKLTVTFGNPAFEIRHLIQAHALSREVIFVLPDRSSQSYVEFKLWDVKAHETADTYQIVFESKMIEWLTGEEP